MTLRRLEQRQRRSPRVPMLPGNRWRAGVRWLLNPYTFLDEALEHAGLTWRARLPVLGDVLFTGDPVLLRELTTGRDFDAGTPITALRSLLGSRSLIMLHGAQHARRRHTIAALFCGETARRHESWMVEQTRQAVAGLVEGDTFSAYEWVQRIALRAILAALFGIRVAEEGEAERLVVNFLRSFRSPLFLFVRPLQVDWGPWTPWGRAMNNRRQLCAFIQRQIASPQAAAEPTLLGQLLTERAAGLHAEVPLDDEEIVEEILSLLLFGHDTGAATMAWGLTHLCQHPAAAERAEHEARDWDRRGTCDPNELPWLQACLQESMRMCPVVVHLGRRATCQTRLGEIPIAKGELVLPCTYLAQHNPAVFPQPNVFRPERFLAGQRYEGSYFPFGFGNRLCVGKPFVSRQMPLLIATLLATVSVRLAPGYRPRPTRNMVLIVPSSGTQLQVAPRKSAFDSNWSLPLPSSLAPTRPLHLSSSPPPIGTQEPGSEGR